MRRALPVAVFFCVVALPLTAQTPVPSLAERPNVHVLACKVVGGMPMFPKPDLVGLMVRFQNDSGRPLSSLVWRANYQDQPVDFTDVGTFTPTLPINNYVYLEVGASRTNWAGIAGDVAALAFGSPERYSTVKTSIALSSFEGTEDPENCALVRATWADGTTWNNPELAQDTPIFAVPIPTPDPQATPPPATRADESIALLPCSLSIANKQARLEVTFRNDGTRPADHVVFRAAYDGSALDFADQGAFAPGRRRSTSVARH